MDGRQYQQHLHHLISRVRGALAAARSQGDSDAMAQAGRVESLLRMQASLERKLADHEAAEEQIGPGVVVGIPPIGAPLDDDLSLEEKRRQCQVLDGEISRISGTLPQLRADLTIAAFHAVTEPSEIERKQRQIDALVQQISLWSAQREYLARQITQQEV